MNEGGRGPLRGREITTNLKLKRCGRGPTPEQINKTPSPQGKREGGEKENGKVGTKKRWGADRKQEGE